MQALGRRRGEGTGRPRDGKEFTEIEKKREINVTEGPNMLTCHQLVGQMNSISRKGKGKSVYVRDGGKLLNEFKLYKN